MAMATAVLLIATATTANAAAVDDTFEDPLARDTYRLAERLAWQLRPRISTLAEFNDDSSGRTGRRAGISIDLPQRRPMDWTLEGGYTELRERGRGELQLPEFAVALRLEELTERMQLQGRVRFRDGDRSDDSVNGWLGLDYDLGDWQDLGLRLAREDVDTVRAKLADVQVDSATLSYDRQLGTLWRARGTGRVADYDDGNRRQAARIEFTRALSQQRRWEAGFDLGYDDGRKQVAAYYTPEKLKFARATLSYQHKWGDGAAAHVMVGSGIARDARAGTRAILDGSADMSWPLGEDLQLRGGIDVHRVPGYNSVGTRAELAYRF